MLPGIRVRTRVSSRIAETAAPASPDRLWAVKDSWEASKGATHLGLANVLNGAWHDALEALGMALTIGGERRRSVLEGGALALMAAAHRGLGERARTLT